MIPAPIILVYPLMTIEYTMRLTPEPVYNSIPDHQYAALHAPMLDVHTWSPYVYSNRNTDPTPVQDTLSSISECVTLKLNLNH